MILETDPPSSCPCKGGGGGGEIVLFRLVVLGGTRDRAARMAPTNQSGGTRPKTSQDQMRSFKLQYCT